MRNENWFWPPGWAVCAFFWVGSWAFGTALPVCTEVGYQGNPSVSGDVVVWEQTVDRGENYAVYALINDRVTRISGPGQARWPDIDGTRVVWSGRHEGDGYDAIWICDISAGGASGERRLCPVNNQSDPNQVHPAISGDLVIWVEGGYPRWPVVWGHSISQNRTFKICEAPGNKWRPDIYDKTVVWGDYRAGNWDIYRADVGDIDHPVETVVAQGGQYQRTAVIHKKLIAYEDGPNLTVYDRVSDKRVSYACGLLNDLAIRNNQVIVSQWTGSGRGYDIYGYRVSQYPALGLTAYPIALNQADQYCVALNDQAVFWCDDQKGGYYERDVYRRLFATLPESAETRFADLEALSQMSRNWQSKGSALTGDLNNNGQVEKGDLGLLIQIYRKSNQ